MSNAFSDSASIYREYGVLMYNRLVLRNITLFCTNDRHKFDGITLRSVGSFFFRFVQRVLKVGGSIRPLISVNSNEVDCDTPFHDSGCPG